MPNIRPLNKYKYRISKHRFYELYHFCMQYNEWRRELVDLKNTIAVSNLDNISQSNNNNSSVTERMALRIIDLQNKCELVEQTAIEADNEIYQYILVAVTTEGVTYNYLKTNEGLPCGKNMYYNRRRKFYYLLSKKV